MSDVSAAQKSERVQSPGPCRRPASQHRIRVHTEQRVLRWMRPKASGRSSACGRVGWGRDLHWSSHRQRAGPRAPLLLTAALLPLPSWTAGYVESLMGRRRPLPRIRAHDPQLRAQAERQAVNFVVQGAGAPLLLGFQPRGTGDCWSCPPWGQLCRRRAGSRRSSASARVSRRPVPRPSAPTLPAALAGVRPRGPAHLPEVLAGGRRRAHVHGPPGPGAPGHPGGEKAGV